MDSFDPKEISRFHLKSDLDASPLAQHHTLGRGRNQAAQGDHDHDDIYVRLDRVMDYRKRYRNTFQTIANTTWTKISFSSEHTNIGDIGYDSTNRFFINNGEPGFFQVHATIQWDTLPSGFVGYIRQLIELFDASSTTVEWCDVDGRTNNNTATSNQTTNTTCDVYLPTGYRLACSVYQNTGASLNTVTPGSDAIARGNQYMSVRRVTFG